MRSGMLATSMALAAMASISVAGAARAVGEIGDDVFTIGGPEPESKESEMRRMAREVDEQMSRRPISSPKKKQANPTIEAAAASKRARKAERLKAWAEKGAIGIQTKAEPDPIQVKAPKKVKAKAPVGTGDDKTKTVGTAKKPVIPVKKKATTKKV